MTRLVVILGFCLLLRFLLRHAPFNDSLRLVRVLSPPLPLVGVVMFSVFFNPSFVSGGTFFFVSVIVFSVSRLILLFVFGIISLSVCNSFFLVPFLILTLISDPLLPVLCIASFVASCSSAFISNLFAK